jgi:hypothetical protein
MIRPFTCVTALLAFGSGLYLYQTKHQAQALDRQIEHTIKSISATRMQTRELAAAWTLLGSPDRLQLLSDQFLGIKPVLPGQFVAIADLDTRLPAPPPPPSPTAVAPDEGAVTSPLAAVELGASPDTAERIQSAIVPSAPLTSSVTPSTSAPNTPAPRLVAVSGPLSSSPSVAADPAKAPAAAMNSAITARQAEHKPSETARPVRDVVAQVRDAPRVGPTNHALLHPTSPSPVIAELDRPVPLAPPRLSALPPMAGSLLGMANTSVRPPAPLPVSTAPRMAVNGN